MPRPAADHEIINQLRADFKRHALARWTAYASFCSMIASFTLQSLQRMTSLCLIAAAFNWRAWAGLLLTVGGVLCIVLRAL
jgi:hypothetical protein